MTLPLPDASTLAALTPTLVDGLHLIGALSQAQTDHAKSALAAIAAIYQTLRAGLTGELKPDDVATAVKSLAESLSENDRGADKALSEKFDNGGES